MKLNNINELAKECHEIAKSKGWWDKPKTRSSCLMLVISELSEAVEADRKNKRANKEFYESLTSGYDNWNGNNSIVTCMSNIFQIEIKDTVEDELADACIRIFDLAKYNKIELDEHAINDTFHIEGVEFSSWCFSITAELHGSYNLKEISESALNLIVTWCSNHEIDIAWHIMEKMKYNKTRQYKHGKAY